MEATSPLTKSQKKKLRVQRRKKQQQQQQGEEIKLDFQMSPNRRQAIAKRFDAAVNGSLKSQLKIPSFINNVKREEIYQYLSPCLNTGSLMGWPDGSAKQTVVLTRIVNSSVKPGTFGYGEGDAGWTLNLMMHAHPVNLLSLRANKASGSNPVYMGVRDKLLVPEENQTLDYQVGAKFAEAIEKYRMLNMSVTVTFTDAATQNQGICRAAQYNIPTRKFNIVPKMSIESLDTAVMPIMKGYDVQDILTYDTISTMPKSYTGKNSDGAYMVLKLGDRSKWITTSDMVGYAGLDTNAADTHVIWPTTILTGVPSLPFLLDDPVKMDETTHGLYGSAYMKMYSDNFGHIIFTGLSPSCSLDIKVCFAFEAIVRPSTTFSNMVKDCVIPDDPFREVVLSLEGDLNDCYPEEANSLSTILKSIKKTANRVASTAFPLINLVPGGSELTEALKVLAKPVNTVMSRYIKK